MKRMIATALLAGASSLAYADNVDQLNALNSTEFNNISKDLMAVFSYKAVAPAEPLGITGFDIGVSLSVTDLEASNDWQKAISSNDRPDSLAVPKIYVQKGLPFDIDIGGFYFAVPDTNLDAWGAEVKYAFMDGGVALPAVAVRAAVTNLTIDDDLTVDTRSVDVSISKGVLMLTPFAGVGKVWADVEAKGNAAALGSLDLSDTRTFVGVSFNPGIFNLAFEADSVGGIGSYNFKLGLAW